MGVPEPDRGHVDEPARLDRRQEFVVLWRDDTAAGTAAGGKVFATRHGDSPCDQGNMRQVGCLGN
jgi:hypothetical protein